MKTVQFLVAIVVLFLVGTTDTAQAGAFGTIKGRVTDSATGEPVIGVSVRIEGTRMGALTDLNGAYVIPRVAPGTYILTFTSVGFGKLEVTDVIVTADLTCEVNETLTTIVSEEKAVTGKSKRDVIRRFGEADRARTEGEAAATKPSSPVDDVLKSVSGVQAKKSGEVFVRGGRSGHEEYIVGGVPIRNPLSQAPQSPLPPFDMTFRDFGTNGWTRVTADPLSTFAIDVDDASYNIVKQYLVDGNVPPSDAVRVEEFINHFNYGYRPPQSGTFRVFTETVVSPFDRNSAFVKVGVKAKEITETRRQPLRLTLVIDVSGSMGYDTRLELVKRGLEMIVDRLNSDDQIAIVAFGSTARTVLSPVDGDQKRQIRNAVQSLYSGGSTYAEAGLKLGYEIASEQYTAGCSNRIILCSDGVANVGQTGPDQIMREVTRNVQSGITLSTFGFGMGNYNDVLMEKLAQKGNGRYAYVNNWDEARNQFVEQLVSNVQVVARDVKIQVAFDPSAVASYRLIGYENRAVADNKFRDNKADGGEVGAGHEVTAVYELQLNRRLRSNQLASVTVRWKEPNQRTIGEVAQQVSFDPRASSFQSVRPELQLAVVASRFGEMLKGTQFSELTSYDELETLASQVTRRMANDQTRELVDLISRARNLTEGYEYYHASEDEDDDYNYKR